MTDERFDQMMRCALTPRSADSRLKQRLKAKMEDEQMTLSVVYDHKGTNDLFLNIAKEEDLSWGVSEEEEAG